MDFSVAIEQGRSTAPSLENAKVHQSRRSIMIGVSAVVVAVMILVVVVVATGVNTPATSLKSTSFHYECLYAVGGGTVTATGGFPQHRVKDSTMCKDTLEQYFAEGSGQYWLDLKAAGEQAIDYYTTNQTFPANDPSQLLVFDIDETTLSNVDEFRSQGFIRSADHEPSDDLKPAIQAILDVYNAAYAHGMSVTFITGRTEDGREYTENNLKAEGYGVKCAVDKAGKAIRSDQPCWIRLDMRDLNADLHKPASVYKPERRQKLIDEGYKIVGSFGDQFSDLEGTSEALASWKLPNPMYYIL